MSIKKSSKFIRLKSIFGGFLVFLGILAGVLAPTLTNSDFVYADPPETTGVTETTDTTETTEATGTTESTEEVEQSEATVVPGETCTKSLGALGWLICPLTGKITEAVDWLYEKIEDLLVINPVEAKDGTPIYEIWKYCLNVTNIVFIIFLLVVIYSQLTGFGINNYGVKKALPKLIVAAIMVNLSFLICVLAVDVSNIIGKSLRGVFTSVQEATIAASGNTSLGMRVPLATMYSALAGGATLAIGAAFIAFETGAIWMLIPVALGAIVSVASGLITIAMRQAVVALLIMIAPLAFVAYILPNTEGLFKKWKSLFIRMLTFYPLFSLLFGASQLAGYALMASAKDGFWMILGVAVQVFPLFFSWSLMKMSGTFLGDINTRLRGLTSGVVARNRAWADSHRQLSKYKYIAEKRPTTPSLRLMQFMSMRKIQRDAETAEQAELVKARALSRRARSFYDKNGVPNRRGEAEYAEQARKMRYQYDIERHAHNMNMGLGQLQVVKDGKVVGKVRKARLEKLDVENMNAADALKMEAARGEMIDYENARGFHNRMEAAINSHFDDLNAGRSDYKQHEMSENERAAARARYASAHRIMEGDLKNVQYVAATAAQGYDTHKKVIETKMQKYFDLTPPTKDVEYRLNELTKLGTEKIRAGESAAKNIDMIVSGLRVLSQRGDTDIIKAQLDNICDVEIGGGIKLGTHASQSLASFLMFDVKDSDPWLRRFGKYINLETANVYNKNRRKVMEVDYDEYVRGYHDEPDPEHPGEMKRMYAKKGMKELMEGTSIDSIERTALGSYDESLLKAYTGKDGKLNYDEYIKRREEVDTAFGPAFISASLKYLSGSEQIASAVKSKTGFGTQQNEDGTYSMVPIWKDKDHKELFEGHEKDIEDWYRDRTLKYLQDQTPTQILGLRSDYRDPLAEHLAKAYQEADMEGWSDEAKAEHNEIMSEWSELQTKYGSLSTDEARAKYKAESEKLKKKMVGAQFRQLLDSKGKLNQIYRTRRSGAANNAKDWVREWLNLDDETAINVKLGKDRDKSNRKKKNDNGPRIDDSGEGDSNNSAYSDEDIANFVSYVDDLWYDMRDEDDESFFEKSMEYLLQNFGKDSFIALEYKRFHEEDPYADSHMLKEYLKDLLSDPNNY